MSLSLAVNDYIGQLIFCFSFLFVLGSIWRNVNQLIDVILCHNLVWHRSMMFFRTEENLSLMFFWTKKTFLWCFSDENKNLSWYSFGRRKKISLMFFWTKKRPFPDILLPATYRAIIVMSLRRWERFLSKMMSHINSFLTPLTPAQLSVWRNVRVVGVVSLGTGDLLLPELLPATSCATAPPASGATTTKSM